MPKKAAIIRDTRTVLIVHTPPSLPSAAFTMPSFSPAPAPSTNVVNTYRVLVTTLVEAVPKVTDFVEGTVLVLADVSLLVDFT